MSKWVRTDSLDYKALRYLSGADLRAALDAVPGLEIVQCKDCRFYPGNEDTTFEEEMCCKWREDEMPEWGDFCSHGLPKEGGKDADK